MFNFTSEQKKLENEGIFIGGWGIKNVLLPKKVNGKHGQWKISSPSDNSLDSSC